MLEQHHNQSRQQHAYINSCLTLVFIILVSRLMYLQLYLGHSLHMRSLKNYTRITNIAPIRGNILDRHATPLATNRIVNNICWRGSGNKHLSHEQHNCIQKLESITHELDKATYDALQHAEKSRTTTTLLKDIPFNQLTQIVEQLSDQSNIFIEKQLQRFYPHKTLACHVIGYISNCSLDHEGKMGLEKIFQNDLKGTYGKQLDTINSLGSSLHHQEIAKALTGNDIHTTIDLAYQRIAEESFSEQYSGALIIMDPENGDLLTVVSRPAFDPSLFLHRIGPQEWHAFLDKKPLINRAFNACYPPASIFKLVILSAAFENNLITEDVVIDCSGFIDFHGKRYHCAKQFGHGHLSLWQAMATSCNILFYEIGKKISINDIAQYAYKFGLGKKTHVLFAEQEGLVPTTTWKYQTFNEPWWLGETLHATIGQGYLLATPIQVACLTASIFQGYLVKPRILQEEPIHTIDLDIKPETRALLKKSMKFVMQHGTGSNINPFEHIKIHGKTGTAQISTLAQRNKNNLLKEHAWFVCRVQYKKTKPLILVILVEHAGSSKVVTKIAKKFVMKYHGAQQLRELTSNKAQ